MIDYGCELVFPDHRKLGLQPWLRHGIRRQPKLSRSANVLPSFFLSLLCREFFIVFALQIRGCKIHDTTVAKIQRQHRRIWILVALSEIEALLPCSFVES